MSFTDYLFGLFVAIPVAALCLVVIAAVYALLPFLLWVWIKR